MALINPIVAEGSRILVRQASSVLESTMASGTPTTNLATSNAFPTPTETSSSNSGPAGSGGGGGGGGSNPLLFFVALGFGVVFTNLWIIVGVKYCFRYNARSRQTRLAEEGDPITMDNMPRPNRRRREKKLISIDEVNEKFPMLKYKTWVASRANKGLSTQGGVTAPATRANSLADADGVIPGLAAKEVMMLSERPPSVRATTRSDKHEEGTSSPTAEHRESADGQVSVVVGAPDHLYKDGSRNSQEEEEDEDEHIDAALPPECMGTSGDTCAICIDTLENDDDVRGLTCGHAFHAVCIDPWLTSRRACCPLCKADYYTPKPRRAAADLGDGTTGVIRVTIPSDPRTNRTNLPSRPRHAFIFLRGQSTTSSPRRSSHLRDGLLGTHGHTRREVGVASQRPRANLAGLFGFPRHERDNPVSAGVAATHSTQAATVHSQRRNRGGIFSGLRSTIASFRSSIHIDRSQPASMGSTTNPAISPSNLEAAVRHTNQ